MSDTITAISTAPGMGAIGIVRISGPATLTISSQFLYYNNSPLTQERIRKSSRQSLFCEFRNDSVLIDKIIYTFYPNPNSFTGEDVAEFHFHGNPILLRQVIDLFVTEGIRPAAPGEFTKRAFLNGKMDLTEAEAIGRLIHSRSRFELELSQKNLFGDLHKLTSRLRSELIGIKAECEAEIDFSTEDLTFESLEERRERIVKIQTLCSNILVKSSKADNLISKSRVVLFGEPNVGKSSLMNQLLGQDRSIISDIPGTTRDYISEDMSISGIPIQLVDTAGIRETNDSIEKLGINQSLREAENANLKLFILDSSKPMNLDQWMETNRLYLTSSILVINKVDISHTSWKEENLFERLKLILVDNGNLNGIIELSCKTGQGVDQLIRLIEERLSDSSLTEEYVMLEDRHKYHFQQIVSALSRANDLIINQAPAEIVVQEIDEAVLQVGQINGIVSNEEVLGRIFSVFCVGK
ncbi:tRNA uridine-5-carboxymethylaminomethyl(34) synthesis GTPase MnmE [Leptospira sp. GIMC2001]|uniref:tRNA uridine-5-carboxymethylaminomethyl(34) synthesis GTPase MnmE n=1 Tax=Leptospira sp. GIMC2001 TaxID=1513297 RepID=UPI00234ACDDA|nr:tRNA uridine-5-carboxymethylaminomethyl(34) synthesis GTPase MnmE [Leptospira sp. GIMC2001]WCL51405.1 tRNA uridine-5-carboxymethylaminomethyl(34) synthesis GTPase MnmE [Leptospira sp. GIMC2001]